MIDVCEGCAHEKDCDSRAEEEPWMYESQYDLCEAAGRPDFVDDDCWLEAERLDDEGAGEEV